MLCAGALLVGGCQSPTDPDDVIGVDDFVDATTSPDPANADVSTDGKTYRVVRGNNQPDEILTFDWKTSFSVTVRLNDEANNEDLDLDWPVDLIAATIKVQQATGGIISPPTGDVEHQDYIISQTTGNRFVSANTQNTMTFDIWYDLPNLRKEAIVTVTLSLKDSENAAFTKTLDVRISP